MNIEISCSNIFDYEPINNDFSNFLQNLILAFGILTEKLHLFYITQKKTKTKLQYMY
jgi:hypothetical protein